MTIQDLDYSISGLTIQQAMVDHARRYPDRTARPKHIRWGLNPIQTSDAIEVPERGAFRIELLSSTGNLRQGVDVKVDGEIELTVNERVPLLRTWWEEQYEGVVEYSFVSRNRLLWIWNVYEATYPSGEQVVEKWTGNAGFWVEKKDKDYIYHCSHGMATPPNFASLVFSLSIRE